MATPEPQPLTVEQALALVTREAQTEAHGCPYCDHVCGERRVIHAMVGGLGGDWDLAEALEVVRQSQDRYWTRHLLGHDLIVVDQDGNRMALNVRRPAGVLP